MEAALACAQLQPLFCEMCDHSSPSVIACVECQKRLCAPCQGIHDQVAGTKYHNLISMETSGYQATGKEADGLQATGLHTHAARKKFCKTHCKHELVFHCFPCDILICHLCRKTCHQGHVTEDVNLVSERIRAQVRDLLQKLEVKVIATTEVITELNMVEQDLERQRQAVVSEAVEAAGKVSVWANQAEDNLVKDVNKMADPVKNELLKRKTAAREVNATLVLLQVRAKLLMKTGSYSELQSLRSDLERSLVSDVTQGEFNPLVHAATGNVKSTVNSTVVSMPNGVRTKDTVFFKRRSSGQEILQNTVPRYVGDVTPGQAEDVAKTTAFTVRPRQQFVAFCVDLNGEGFSVLSTGRAANKARLGPPRHHIFLQTNTLKGESIGDFAFVGRLTIEYRLMQPWPDTWLITNRGQLQLINATGQYKNEDTGQLIGPSASISGVLSNSSPNGHVYVINNEISNCVWEIQMITLDPDGNISVKPLFQVVYRKTLHGFDVSADEAHFATINSFHKSVKNKSYLNIEVNVYQRREAQPFARFTTSVHADQVRNSRGVAYEACLCFSRYKGKEVLRLSVWCEDCVYVLDQRNGCSVVHQTNISSPLSLRRDCREKVWVGLEDNSFVVFET